MKSLVVLSLILSLSFIVLMSEADAQSADITFGTSSIAVTTYDGLGNISGFSAINVGGISSSSCGYFTEQNGKSGFERQDYENALYWFEEYAADCKYGTGPYYLGLTYINLGDYQQAEYWLQRYLDLLNPEVPISDSPLHAHAQELLYKLQRTDNKYSGRLSAVLLKMPESFTTFSNSNFDFTINYPSNWYAVRGFTLGHIATVYDHPNETLFQTDFHLTELIFNSDIDSLEFLETRSRNDCASVSVPSNGFSCSNYEVVVKNLERIGAFDFYGFVYSYDLDLTNGKSESWVNFIMQIDYGLDSWLMFSQGRVDAYNEYSVNGVSVIESLSDDFIDSVLTYYENESLGNHYVDVREISIASGTNVPGCQDTLSCYQPYNAKITVGQTITWKNNDDATHTVSHIEKDYVLGGAFDSGLMSPGDTYSVSLENEGVYAYYCVLHPWMTGKLLVVTDSPPEPTTPPEPTKIPPKSDLVYTTKVTIPQGTGVPGCEENNKCYSPFVITITKGDTITWINEDNLAHTVTSGSLANGPSGAFDSGFLVAGETFDAKFDKTGTYDYFCMLHPWMNGQVVVDANVLQQPEIDPQQSEIDPQQPEIDPQQPEIDPQQPSSDSNGGCLIATATYGTELAPQVQFLREIRDNTILSTESGVLFMTGFNSLYYSFSPFIADMERENPIFKEMVRLFITPMISTLSIMTLAEDGNESQVLGLGISVIALNVGMYLAAPVVAMFGIRKFF